MPSFGYVVFCESLVNPNSLRFGPFGGPFCLPQVNPIQSSFATGAGNAAQYNRRWSSSADSQILACCEQVSLT